MANVYIVAKRIRFVALSKELKDICEHFERLSLTKQVPFLIVWHQREINGKPETTWPHKSILHIDIVDWRLCEMFFFF